MTGIKDVNHCWKGRSTEITYRISMLSPVSEIKGGGMCLKLLIRLTIAGLVVDLDYP